MPFHLALCCVFAKSNGWKPRAQNFETLNMFEMQETDCSTFYSCHTREMLSYSIVWSLAGLGVRLMPTHIKEFESLNWTFLTYFGAELRSPDRVSYCNSSSKLSCLHFCMWQLSRSVRIQFMDDYCKACQLWHSTPANIVTFFLSKSQTQRSYGHLL